MVESSWESPQEPLSIQSDLGDYSPEPSNRGERDPQETLVPVPQPRHWWNRAANIDTNMQMKESRQTGFHLLLLLTDETRQAVQPTCQVGCRVA